MAQAGQLCDNQYHSKEINVLNDLAQALTASLNSRNASECEEFIRLAQPVVAAGVVRAVSRWRRPAREQIDDFVQETFVRLYANNAKVLRDFRGTTSLALAAYLRVVASSVVLDSFRSTMAQRHGAGQAMQNLDDMGAVLPSSADTFKSVEQSLLTEKINRCLQAEKDRDRSIFWLYFRQGLSARQISEMRQLDIGSKGVETTIFRVSRAVRECLGKGGYGRAATAGGGNPA